MTDHDTAGAHDAGQDDHAAGHDDHDDHGAGGLGPIDWPMWGAGVLGVIVATIMLGAFIAATGFVFFGVTA